MTYDTPLPHCWCTGDAGTLNCLTVCALMMEINEWGGEVVSVFKAANAKGQRLKWSA